MVLHLASTVLASPVPSATPSPEVIKQTIIQPVQQTPTAVIQLFQLLGLAAAGAVTSILHWLAERGKWSANVNRLVWGLYSLLGGVAYAALTGHLGSSAVDLGTQAYGVLGMAGGSSMFYNLVQFLNQVLENAQAPSKPTEPAEAAATS